PACTPRWRWCGSATRARTRSCSVSSTICRRGGGATGGAWGATTPRPRPARRPRPGRRRGERAGRSPPRAGRGAGGRGGGRGAAGGAGARLVGGVRWQAVVGGELAEHALWHRPAAATALLTRALGSESRPDVQDELRKLLLVPN